MYLNDGKFEVVFIKTPKNIIEFLRIVNSILSKNYKNKKEILYFKTDNLELEIPDKAPWTLDGEYGGNYNQIKINNIKQGTEFIVP